MSVSFVVGFVDILRRGGLAVAPSSAMLFAEALTTVDLAAPDEVYWAGRSTLVHRPEDIELFDGLFVAYWGRGADGVAWRPPQEDPTVAVALDDPEARRGDGPRAPEPEETIVVRYSETEVLAEKDFARYTDAELDEAQRLMAAMRVGGALRRSRRPKPHKGPSGALDLRRTVRAALHADGETVKVARRRPGVRPRRLVMLLDVSGSMEPYARALIRFLHAAVAGRTRVEAFALGTRLTRLTRELSSRDPDRAMRAAATAVDDWSGGTRLGEGLRRFNDEWGCRGMARGAVVAILSDGWDRGDPAEMDEQMARLHRAAHRVVWVNPLKASPGYQPLARGMAAALPHVDEFLEGHCLDSLETLAAVLLARRTERPAVHERPAAGMLVS